MSPRKYTLDNMSSRIRPRDYSSMYAQRRQQPVKVVSDFISQPAIQKAKVIEQEAIHKAKQLIDIPKPSAPLKIQVAKKNITQDNIESPQKNKVVRPVSLLQSSVDHGPKEHLQISKIVDNIQQQSSPNNLGDFQENIAPRRLSMKQTISNMFETRRSIVLSVMSLLLMVGGVVALAGSFSTNQKVEAQVKVLNEVASASIDNESLASDEGIPSEDPVPEPVIDSYSPPADEPRYIYIPKLKNKKTRVLKMGLDNNGSIKTPRTTWDTGWYQDSSKPGDKIGAAFIVGHVSGLTTGGVFYNLYRLENGDEITIENGDGTKYTYNVVGKEEVPLDGINMNNYLVSKDIDKPGLTLMTCAGEYNPVTQTYDNRLAVFAVRQN